MFIYTEKDRESDKRIKNNNLLYTAHQTHQNIFQAIQHFRKMEHPQN